MFCPASRKRLWTRHPKQRQLPLRSPSHGSRIQCPRVPLSWKWLSRIPSSCVPLRWHLRVPQSRKLLPQSQCPKVLLSRSLRLLQSWCLRVLLSRSQCPKALLSRSRKLRRQRLARSAKPKTRLPRRLLQSGHALRKHKAETPIGERQFAEVAVVIFRHH